MDEADKPWYLRPTAGPNEIQVDPDGTVRGGTIPALVERLTTHEKSDIKFNQAFLMTYRSFMTPDELCDQLFARFAITPPDELNPKELEEWNMIKQHIVQTRVLNTLRTMVLDEELDPEGEDAEMLERIKAFANSAFASSEQPSQQAAAKALGNLTERVQHGYSPVRKVVSTEQPPQPIVPRSVNRKLLPTDIDPLELARQLSIIESQLFQKIRPAECFARAQGRHRTDDNIAVLIKTSNRIVNWLADCVLGKESPVQRAAVVKHFINVADKCRELNNFSSMWAIVSGLNRPHIRRLKRTWEHVDNRTTQRFRACEALLDSTLNFENYRMALHNASPPGVPFFGECRFMSALTFIEDGNQDRLGDEMINFVKRQRSADIVTRIKLWQSKPYSFKPVPIIQTYLDESLTRFSDDEHLRDYFWNLSLRREPREREDERMNRLLYESGFL
ncbi:ras GEF [Punctularia strigosozonata HHB-11173 SS5]|uniref:ras GEF n=1 Tax=Punctularia strigosozonata (strain HHB-11173) TaxID=741275 RepID=UPI00044184FD|nr:ras GEF [Punctularia strigosozonata HHB-11173 SS5]EIN12588.1 ras GEF [Punctularia strigosozonata HHB-11173 SS5]